jgi:O-antigen ligase
MFFPLITLFGIIFAAITWRNMSLGLVIFFALLPTYLIRFSIGPIPTTFLEIMVVIILFIASVKKETRKSLISNSVYLISKNKLLLIGVGLFLLGATISVFTATDMRTAAGEWKAFYVEPILIFFILIALFKSKITRPNLQSSILFALTLSGLVVSIFAIFQHATGWLVPDAFWENRNTFRVTAWYGFPNAVGLFLAPIIPLALYLITRKINTLKKKAWKLSVVDRVFLVSCFLFLVSAPLAMFYAKSTGAIIGLIGGIGIMSLFYKKTRWPAIIIGIIGIVSLLGLPIFSNIKKEVLFQDRSGHIRISMWKETAEFLTDHPILGAGLGSYDEKIVPHHTTVNGEGIEIFHHPHNIFLTMWVNLGIIGLLGFLCVLAWFFTQKPETFLVGSMATILIMGLVDSPYIKNDLAILFWLLPAILVSKKIIPIVPKTKK